MSMNKSADPESRNLMIVAVIGGVGVLLCACLAAVFFFVGGSSIVGTESEPVAETLSEIQEVTRVVIVEVTPAPEEETTANIASATTNDDKAVDTSTPIPTPTDEPKQPTAPVDSKVEDIDFSTFYETWEIIESEFDGQIPLTEELLQAAIMGSLETLDDEFTRYIEPDIAERLREDMGGSVSGIGAFVRENEEGQFEIVRPIDGQPADLAGLLAGDIVTAVDGELASNFSFDELILRVRGPEGTAVTLTIQRENEPEALTFTIVRTVFEIPVIESEMLENDIAYIRLTEFNRNAEERLLETMDELITGKTRGLIFDLRDNPGGFLDQSVAVADVFLPDGVALFGRSRQGLDRTFPTRDGDVGEAITLVVLVNAGSASASEIVAGAIQDRGRAVLIGETTFGKGSVQQVHELSDGAELRVTIARWYTPNNNTIDGVGITPDIEIETPVDLGGEDDPQIQRAIDYIMNGE